MELRIKEVIKQKGTSVTEVSEKMGISRVNLSNMINGGNPTLATLEKIADALDVSVVELFERPSAEVLGVVRVGSEVHTVGSVEELRTLVESLE